MGMLSVPPSRDPRHQPGAYVSRWGHLYEIIGPVTEGTNKGLIQAVNCRDDATVYLTPVNMGSAKLVRAAPELDVPDTIPGEAA